MSTTPAAVTVVVMTYSHSDTQLAKVYYDPSDPAGFAGASKLSDRFPKYKSVKTWLSSQPTYTLHKPMKRRFPTRKYKSSAPNEFWQMDLLEMIPYARVNRGYRYILTCIDVYSRFARAEALKSKDAYNVSHAIESILKLTVPRHIQTDLGKEFYNKSVKNLFKRYGINHYSVHSQYKAAVVERFNRTLRERLNRYFTRNGSKVWIDVLPHIIKAYNHSIHRSLSDGKRPIDIIMNNDQQLAEWRHQELPKTNTKKVKPLPIKSLVRISRISVSSPFRKNFDQNWSEEIFRINAIDSREKPVMYILEDMNNQILQGKFYRQELQLITAQDNAIYRIERVIRTQGKGKHKRYLVKWHGYDNTHNSWISANQFVSKF